MNKLRALSFGGGVVVVATALWATVHYGGSSLRFAEAALFGLVGAGLPSGIASLKGAVRSLRRRRADVDERLSAERGSIFVSDQSIDDPVDCLETVLSVLRAEDRYDEVGRETFEEGPGLSIVHDGFHSSFVRITGAGRVVVTGASKRTHALADLVSETCSLTFERTQDNPFKGSEPVRGAPRVFLGVLIFVVLLAGTNAVGAAAYTDDAYNPAERMVLVGIDIQGDLRSDVSETDTALSKAAFLVDIVEEGTHEVQWAEDDSDRAVEQGRQALVVSNNARTLLATVRAESPSSEQLERADRIERRLGDAEHAVADTLDERADESDEADAAALRGISDRLRSNADTLG